MLSHPSKNPPWPAADHATHRHWPSAKLHSLGVRGHVWASLVPFAGLGRSLSVRTSNSAGPTGWTPRTDVTKGSGATAPTNGPRLRRPIANRRGRAKREDGKPFSPKKHEGEVRHGSAGVDQRGSIGSFDAAQDPGGPGRAPGQPDRIRFRRGNRRTRLRRATDGAGISGSG